MEHARRAGWVPSPQHLAAALLYGPTPVPTAIRRCEQLLEEMDRGGEASLLVHMSGLEAMRGRFGEARQLAARGQALYEELGWNVHLATPLAPVVADIDVLSGRLSSGRGGASQ